MSEHGQSIPFDEAMDTVRAAARARAVGAETVTLAEAGGRITAAEQTSRLDMPPFNKSAMDGYAIPDADPREQYDVVGPTVQAGAVPDAPLAPGQAVKVMTGAPVPDGTAKVIRVEDTREAGGVVTILGSSKGNNICYHGEDVRTGDEIVDTPDQIGPGKIMNSNGPMVAALGAKFHFDVVSVAHAKDTLDDTIAVISAALDAADIVVLSGGVSVGDFDFVGTALAELGLTVHFTSVAVKPGRPLTFASAPGKAVFGLPGNPVSVYLMFHVFLLHAAELMCGLDRTRRIAIALDANHTRRKAERVECVPCRLTERGTVEAITYHGSGHLLAMTHADGFFIMPRGVKEFPAGQVVQFVPIGSSVQ